MRSKVTTAVFPVAGLGTRILPATKSIPKEILTLVDRPLVQYAVDEARAAGIKEFIFVTSRGKHALEDYFDRAVTLERTLEERGRVDLLEILSATNMESGAIAYIRQHTPLGLGHAVWCARRLVGNQPFAVILPDDVIAAEKPCLQQMVEAYDETGGNMVAAMEVPPDQTASYGILDVRQCTDRVMPVRGMVEKPPASRAPSNIAIIGRYILTARVMESLDRLCVDTRSEIQLTDAVADQISGKEGVYAYRFDGVRHDCGSKAGYLCATVAFALARDELVDDLQSYLRGLHKRGAF